MILRDPPQPPVARTLTRDDDALTEREPRERRGHDVFRFVRQGHVSFVEARQAEFEIHFDEGISYSADILDMAVANEIVQKSGTWFSFENEKLGQGKENTRKFLSENPKLLNKIEKMVIDASKAKDK